MLKVRSNLSFMRKKIPNLGRKMMSKFQVLSLTKWFLILKWVEQLK